MGEHEDDQVAGETSAGERDPIAAETEGTADGEQGASSAEGGSVSAASTADGDDGTAEDRGDVSAGEDSGEDVAAAGDGAGSDDEDDDGPDEEEQAAEEERRREEFAREHDPADHDIAAGEEFRQPGDWTADEDGPQQLETERSMVAAGASGSTSESGDGGEGGHGGDEADGEGLGAGDDGGEEIRDGGHGWGSAAPVEGGGTPPGHPVKAWHDTMTYVLPDEEGYGADPHECFVDGETAERAGFRHAHG